MGAWRAANGCDGAPAQWPTRFDGDVGLYCVREGSCAAGGDAGLVHCSWGGAHHVPGAADDPTNTAQTPRFCGMRLMWDFLKVHQAAMAGVSEAPRQADAALGPPDEPERRRDAPRVQRRVAATSTRDGREPQF